MLVLFWLVWEIYLGEKGEYYLITCCVCVCNVVWGLAFCCFFLFAVRLGLFAFCSS